ncbi:MAG: translation elongation factor G [Elusimicrobia bacterium RIFOXYB2_FULL_62_6]|nr:MAG: translation elongation factor G [Elusimicrobia bacterium RIFOXYB2_FULL_62_6]
MKTYETQKLRNVVFLGHSGSGKTTLIETLLFNTGVINRMGNTADGTTVSDYQPEEVKRKISIYTSLVSMEANEHKFNFLDTPGYTDFIGETIAGLRAAEIAVFTADGVDGLGVGSDQLWKRLKDNKLSAMVVINKLDKERADFSNSLNLLREKFGTSLAPVQAPIGSQAQFSGIVDLIKMKAYSFEGGKAKEIPVPADADVTRYREMFMESLAETDEALLAKYLDGQAITPEEMAKALKNGIASGKFIPVLCSSVAKNIGVSPVLGMLADYFPSPEGRVCEAEDDRGGKIEVKCDQNGAFSGFVFKASMESHVGELCFLKIYSGKLAVSSGVYNSTKRHNERVGQIAVMQGKTRSEVPTAFAGDVVVLQKLKSTESGDTLCDQAKEVVFPKIVFPEPVHHLAIKAKSKDEQEKISFAFNSFKREDPTFKAVYNNETKEMIISGIGDVHLDVLLDKFHRQHNVGVDVSAPRIPYKETIRAKSRAQGKYKKQTGGRGQYGDCWLSLEPMHEGKGFEFVNDVVGGAIPRNFIPAVEKGIIGAMEEGVVAGYTVVDLKATVDDGSYHEVDSSEMAFKIAGSMAFKKAFAEARPTIMEPITILEVHVPKAYVGDVMGDINKRRGRILSMEEDTITAQVPLSEISRYCIDLRSITRGYGYFSNKFSHYEEAPREVQQELMNKYAEEKAKGELSVK